MDKISRNSPCFCGSGKKYKYCCLKNPVSKTPPQQVSSAPAKRVISRDKTYIDGMIEACRLAQKCMREVEKMMKPGMTGKKIDTFIYDYFLAHKAVPATLNYQGYTASCCVSPNNVICHGIPNSREFKEGDIVNVDLTPNLNGYFGDINETFLIGECSEEARKIVEVSRICLEKGIEAIKPYGHIGDIGAAIQEYAHSQGCSVVEKFVGHGIGRKFHDEPQVPHFGKRGKGPVIYPGMFFTIEPMINLGTKHLEILEDKWTAVTKDGSLSSQFEHTVMITEESARVLTAETEKETPD